MLVRAHSFAIHRGIAEHVIVELDVRAGLPAFSVIGLAGGAARDARERVRAAVLNSGLAFPRKRVTVNLAPASARRTGSEFDLAIACCVAAADGLIPTEHLGLAGLFAELGLGGELRPAPNPGAAALTAGEAGLSLLVVARPDLSTARAADTVAVAGLRRLTDVVATLAARPARRPAGAFAVPWEVLESGAERPRAHRRPDARAARGAGAGARPPSEVPASRAGTPGPSGAGLRAPRGGSPEPSGAGLRPSISVSGSPGRGASVRTVPDERMGAVPVTEMGLGEDARRARRNARRRSGPGGEGRPP